MFVISRVPLHLYFRRETKLSDRFLAEGGEEEELYSYTRKEQPVFIFITDMLWFINTIYSPEGIAQKSNGFMQTLTLKGRYHNIYFIAALNIGDKSGVRGYDAFKNFISYGTGIHFGGKISANDMLNFDYMPFKEREKSEKAGIGQIPEMDGEAPVQKIVVPLLGKRKKKS